MGDTKYISYNLSRILFSVALLGIPVIFFNSTLVIGSIWLVYKIVKWNRLHFVRHEFDTKDKGVFITGCDSGLGYAFACHLDRIGFTVFAGVLNGEGEGANHLKEVCSKKLHVVPINDTQDDSIAAALDYVKKHLPAKGLWSVINNAGRNVVGEVEFTTVELYEKAFNVNLYGALRVMKSFLPLIRNTNGRIINITSVHGRAACPRQSNYETAKHGLETISDSLRMEMVKFGVKVIIVEPGAYGYMTSIENEDMVKNKTSEVEAMWNASTPEMREGYSKPYVMSWLNKPMVHGWTAKSRDISPLSRAVEHALCSERPEERYLVGGLGTVLAFIDEWAVGARLYNILPTWMTDFVWREICHGDV